MSIISVTDIGKNLLPDSSEIIKPVTKFSNRESLKLIFFTIYGNTSILSCLRYFGNMSLNMMMTKRYILAEN